MADDEREKDCVGDLCGQCVPYPCHVPVGCKTSSFHTAVSDVLMDMGH